MFANKIDLKKVCQIAGRKRLVTLLMGWMLVAMAGNTQAATVNGTIEFQVTYMNVFELGSEVGVDFGSLVPFSLADGVFDTDISTGSVFISTGDFVTAGVVGGSTIFLTDFRFDLTGSPNPVATVGSFEFSMLSLVPPGAGAPDFTGSGFLHDTSNNFDDTQVDWSFNANTNIFAVVGLSATGNPVPVPGALVLFASALGGLTLVRRKV